MHALRVQYQVQPGYAATNAANIQALIAELRGNPLDGLYYSAFCKEDGVTFVHLVIAPDEEALGHVPSLDAFKTFQTALVESQPVVPPAQEKLGVVGLGY